MRGELVVPGFPEIRQPGLTSEDIANIKKFTSLGQNITLLITDSSIRPEIQRYAMTQVLTRPFENRDWVAHVVGNQAEFMADFVSGGIEYIHKHPENKLLGESIPVKYVLPNLNAYIPPLIPKVSEMAAQKLFDHFDIRKPLQNAGIESQDAYQPLEALYKQPEVEEKWKQKGAERMHEVVQAEASGLREPRHYAEFAPVSYGGLLRNIVREDGTLPISDAFYNDEVTFLLNLDNKGTYINGLDARKVLSGIRETELRHRVARHQVLARNYPFTLYDRGDLNNAKRLQREFPADQELITVLDQAIDDFLKTQNKKRVEKIERRRVVADLLERMRNS